MIHEAAKPVGPIPSDPVNHVAAKRSAEAHAFRLLDQDHKDKQTAKAYEDIAASQAKTNRENLVNNKQIIKLQKETLLVEAQTADQQYITATIRPAELLKIQSETQLTDARKAEVLAATIRSDLESAQKVLLMAAQTLGFASDTKQKLLKQMQDGFAVALSIAGVGNVPEANQDKAIDDLTQELLVNIGSSVVIESEQIVPVL